MSKAGFLLCVKHFLNLLPLYGTGSAHLWEIWSHSISRRHIFDGWNPIPSFSKRFHVWSWIYGEEYHGLPHEVHSLMRVTKPIRLKPSPLRFKPSPHSKRNSKNFVSVFTGITSVKATVMSCLDYNNGFRQYAILLSTRYFIFLSCGAPPCRGYIRSMLKSGVTLSLDMDNKIQVEGEGHLSRQMFQEPVPGLLRSFSCSVTSHFQVGGCFIRPDSGVSGQGGGLPADL